MAVYKHVPEHAIPANNLLDHLLEKMSLKNDAALARNMQVPPPVISKIRHGRIPIGAAFIIQAHEYSSMSIGEIKRIAGLPSFVADAG